ncbi:tRNA/rRNA methyltransferase (SpoU) family protein [Euphorbia peplus]|nr:tRNA/rRNA methyltransferase (SpoU) family protein [Euphorbia peplus]
MCSSESNSMEDSVIASLSNSFKQVPLSAIPAMLDCILASTTAFSPSSLFVSLLDPFPALYKDFTEDGHKLDSGRCEYLVSTVGALCHLLKKPGIGPSCLRSFIWKCFVPLMNMAHAFEREFLNQIPELFFDVVSITNSWGVLEATLVPFFLRSAGLSVGMLQNEESDIFEWSNNAALQGLDDIVDTAHLDKESMLSISGSFPLSVSCHILTLILDSAWQSSKRASTSEPVLENGQCYAEKLFTTLLWDLCNMSERLFLRTLEHRSCAMSFLFPILFKSFGSHHSLVILVRGKKCFLSRNLFFRKIWKCCKLLFSLGPLERRDAYCILSLYLSFFYCVEGSENSDSIDRAEEFDVRDEKEFWDEIKRGLVDEESLVRKQSLHILKKALEISGGRQPTLSLQENKSLEKCPNPQGMGKRALWAEKEAKSLGVGEFCASIDSPLDVQQQWEAFILLYEMLEEYGTHLVEAAWEHQITLLLQFSVSNDNFASSTGRVRQSQIEILVEVFSWLTILWQLGFRHDNPHVRCLIMQSFLDIKWTKYGNSVASLPKVFILGSFIEGLNDPVHHKDFGLKGVYTSRTIEGAATFLHQYSRSLNVREGIEFLHSLASLAKQQSFARAGLMGLAECIASTGCGLRISDAKEVKHCEDALPGVTQQESSSKQFHPISKTDLLDVLRFVIESSKRHFNPSYRLRVCEKAIEAASSVVSTNDVPLESLLHFISALPQEFTDYGGSLRVKVQEWLLRGNEKHCSSEMSLLKSLQEFPERFTCPQLLVDAIASFDDEDLDAWEYEAKRWARMLFLVIKGEADLVPILTFIQNRGTDICKHSHISWSPVKFLVLIMNMVREIQTMWDKVVEHAARIKFEGENSLLEASDQFGYAEASVVNEKLCDLFLSLLEELVSFASTSCSIFLKINLKDASLPSCVSGRLGGPSQRRLPSSTAAAVLTAITSMRAVESIASWCAHFRSHLQIKFAWTFMWKFFWDTVSSPSSDTEIGAEVCLAAYEALVPALRALVSSLSPLALDLIKEKNRSPLAVGEGETWLDQLVLSFLQNINNLLSVGVLVRTRRAVLLNWKWLCLQSLLSIPHYALENGLHAADNKPFFSDAAIKCIFSDLVESLEHAGEGSGLPMLRSIRLILGLLASRKSDSLVSSCSGVDCQMMWHLARSSWILHVGNKKRRVASIAALLSCVLHPSVFADEGMHSSHNETGPLKWFVENILEEGTKSPRTIRLAALHLTGLWLSHPRVIKYYIKELKLLTLYGSVQFDEDFEAELAENRDARTEVSLLAKSPNSELAEAFINTELYARASVAVLFYNLAGLANLVGSANENEDCRAALESGKLFLLELLDSVVNDKDLAKELYKKYSAIHRRKIRAWQMICVLSQFIRDDTVGQVTCSLHIALNRNNLPAVRQYLETFAINIYLTFPPLVGEQLVPILQDYDMKPQALSSYVFIAANIILHAPEAYKSSHLDKLLPPIVPLLTSHHHSLRGFTQLLVYQVFSKCFFPLDRGASGTMCLEKQCFEDLKSYLGNNPDCKRLRASMEGYLDAYDPIVSSTPAGIFVNRVEEVEFECAPTSLLEEVLHFLNNVREELRSSMAKDVVSIKNESLKIDEDCNTRITLPNAEPHKDASFDFQKKVIPAKHEKKDVGSDSIFGINGTYKQLLEMEREDDLLDQSLQSSVLTMRSTRSGQQDIILVASFLDRIPNLAGLARTCEVFKASGLAIADASVLHDKQFQLISVTAEKWVPIIEVPENSVKHFLEKKKQEGFSILGLEQTANSLPLDQYVFPKKTVLVLGREKEGIPVDIIHILDACIEIPQLGVIRSLNVHVSGAIALWEYTRQQRSQ